MRTNNLSLVTREQIIWKIAWREVQMIIYLKVIIDVIILQALATANRYESTN